MEPVVWWRTAWVERNTVFELIKYNHKMSATQRFWELAFLGFQKLKKMIY